MIRAVDNKRLDLSDEEYSYYLGLVESFGKDEFVDLFSTDKNGQITSINPPLDRQISMGVMFFVLNVMMNQRLRALGRVVQKNEKNVVESSRVDNIEERLEGLEQKLRELEGSRSK